MCIDYIVLFSGLYCPEYSAYRTLYCPEYSAYIVNALFCPVPVRYGRVQDKTDKTDSNPRRTIDVSPVRLPNINIHGTDILNFKQIENGH